MVHITSRTDCAGHAISGGYVDADTAFRALLGGPPTPKRVNAMLTMCHDALAATGRFTFDADWRERFI